MSSGRTEAIPGSGKSAPDTGGKTRDAILDGRLTVIQPKSGPRAAIDALFLAAAVPAEEGRAQSVLEAGTGTGVASLALCARVRDAQVTCVDIQPELLSLARESSRLNGMDDRVTLIEADVTAPGKELDESGLRRESFAHVAANPPFFTRGELREAKDPVRAKAYSAGRDDMEKWVKFLTRMAEPNGTLTLIHKADALGTLLSLLQGRFGDLTVFPLFPREGVRAKRILVQGIKGSRAPLRLLPGMVLHEGDGDYTAEADAVLRGMAPLDLRGA